MAAATGGKLTELLVTTRKSCEALAPVVRAIYASIDDSTRKEKKDSSLFSIADGFVQHALVNWLFKDRIANIVGEESAKVNVDSKPYTVDDMEIPAALWPLIDSSRSTIEGLRLQLGELPPPSAPPSADHSPDTAEKCRIVTGGVDSVFIDPIDGTREFCTGLGHQSTICVGFARAGEAVAGLVFRPIPDPPTWADGCREENHATEQLDLDAAAAAGEAAGEQPGFLTTNGSISPFLAALIEQLGYRRVPSGGAGNKMLMLLENKGAVYLQDRGLSRWDTCAAEAVLYARRGVLSQLHPFVETHQLLRPYRYVRGSVNVDFVPGVSRLSAYNRSSPAAELGSLAVDSAQVLPYANLLGLLAVSPARLTPAYLKTLYEAIHHVITTKQLSPAYD